MRANEPVTWRAAVGAFIVAIAGYACGTAGSATVDVSAGSGAGGSAPDDAAEEIAVEGDASDDANREDTSDDVLTSVDAGDATSESADTGARVDAANDARASGDAGVIDSADARPEASSRPDASADAAKPDASLPLDAARRDDAGALGKSCVETCNTDDDCVPSLPVGTFQCDTDRHRCIACRNDATCVAAASGWVVGCTTTADCGLLGDACVDVGGTGKCAFTSVACGGAFPDDIAAAEFGTGTPITVCGVATSHCADGQCIDLCGPLHTCTPQQGGTSCNSTTGRCECSTDNDCAGGVGVSQCNTATHACECAANADCAGSPEGDVCVGGKCGCSGVDACTRKFSATSITCQ